MNILQKAKKDNAKIYLKTAGISIISGERDIEVMTNEISEDEKILCIITGKLVQISNDRSRGIRGNQATGTDTKGVLVVTDQKAVFADKRLMGKQIIIIEGYDITSVSVASGLMSSRLEIMSVGSRYDISDLPKIASQEALVALNQTKKNARQSGTTQVLPSGMEEIKKAKELLDMGIISQTEFNAIKKKHLR